ncbi:MAG: hypothetical protein K5853_06015 [Lachnospiraceae bacterium]|nr:hypothetical protein [Lachnospiraceae bacterium]
MEKELDVLLMQRRVFSRLSATAESAESRYNQRKLGYEGLSSTFVSKKGTMIL